MEQKKELSARETNGKNNNNNNNQRHRQNAQDTSLKMKKRNKTEHTRLTTFQLTNVQFIHQVNVMVRQRKWWANHLITAYSARWHRCSFLTKRNCLQSESQSEITIGRTLQKSKRKRSENFTYTSTALLLMLRSLTDSL